MAVSMHQAAAILFTLVGACAAFTDYRAGKIYNVLTLPAMGIGLMLGALQGWGSFAQAAGGVALGFALFFPLFVLGIMGAGDGKLIMALGTVLGVQGTWHLVAWSMAVGSAGAIVLMVVRGRLKPFARECAKFFQSVFTPGLALHWPRLDKDSKAPFGLAIFAAYLIVRFSL